MPVPTTVPPPAHAEDPLPAPPTLPPAPAPRLLHPLRLAPGDDLRAALEALAATHGAGFVVAGIGSLSVARLRLAGAPEAGAWRGDLELLTLAGSLSSDGAHLHASVSTADGRVIGGHVAPGCVVRTTAEVLVAWLPGWALSRAPDPATGWKELVARRAPDASAESAASDPPAGDTAGAH
jgi:hypothetical protein